MNKHCCDEMTKRINQRCEQHPDPYDCPDNLIIETKWGYGLIVHDGGPASIAISYCPWCGKKLKNDLVSGA